MAEHFEEVISVRMAELAQSVDTRFDAVDARLVEIRDHFVEMRDFTTFCFEKLGREVRDEIKGSESRLSRRLDRHELVLGEILTEVKALRPR